MFHCVCVCLYSFLVRTGNKTPNFIMGHYDKSHTLDICSNPLLLEILKNNLSFHPLPDSALGVGTCSWPVAAEHRNSTIQAGQGAGIARPIPKSGGRCALASVCSGLHLLLPFPNVCPSPLPSLPNKTGLCSSCSAHLAFCLWIHISHRSCSDSARWIPVVSVSFFLVVRLPSFHPLWLSYTPLFSEMASFVCSQINSDAFLSSVGPQTGNCLCKRGTLLLPQLLGSLLSNCSLHKT